MNWFKTIMYICLYGGLLGLLGIFEIVVMEEMNWQLLTNGEFWIEQSTTNFFYFSFFVITAALIFDLLASETIYSKLEDDIENNMNLINTSAFREYHAKGQLKDKKDAWVTKKNIELSNHMTNIKHETHMEFTLQPKENWNKKTKKWVDKKEKLELQLKEEWINTHIYALKVNYPEITLNEIYFGVQTSSTSKSRLERNPLRKQVVLKLFMIFANLFAIIITEIMKIDELRDWRELVKSLSFMLVMIVVNIILGINAGRKAHKDRISNTNIRKGIIEDYKLTLL